MRLTFLGACHEVTGSCTLLEINGKYGLVDCGMEQGKNVFANEPLPISPAQVDFLLLTHAHIDHSGNIPKLYKDGFQGKIFTTGITTKLCGIMLRDSAHIQESEAEWRNRKNKRSGEPLIEPDFTIQDVEGALTHFVPCEYGQRIQVAEGVEVRFTDIGHLLGSACIEIWLTEDGVTKKIVFSGDVGNINQPIINDPMPVAEADYVVLESTYGDRLHGERPDYIGTLAGCIQRTLDRGGNVVIPAFAVGRTQEMLYFIREIKERGLVTGHPDFPVYVDSPLANEATTIFQECSSAYFDSETRALLDAGVNPLVFPGLRRSLTSDDSKQINFDSEPKVIISASGMCDAGRIRHHLKHNLWRKESLVLFVGYQSAGTLGRTLYEGAKHVRLFGEDVEVNAEIAVMPGISGHADKNGLLAWLGKFAQKPGKVFINHGEAASADSFTACLREEHGYDAYAPYSGCVYDLKTNVLVYDAKGVYLQKPAKARKSAAFAALLAALERITNLVRRSEGMANKELRKRTQALERLADEWER